MKIIKLKLNNEKRYLTDLETKKLIKTGNKWKRIKMEIKSKKFKT